MCEGRRNGKLSIGQSDAGRRLHHVPLGLESGEYIPGGMYLDKALTRDQFKCGDSYFTKYSPCSFDRAAHAPGNLMNPLHSSITPFGELVSSAVHETGAPRKCVDTT
jgi:hypothetical protein